MVKSSWLYSLRKEELSEICSTLELDTKGTVEEMRKAVTALITAPDLAADMKMKLMELETSRREYQLFFGDTAGKALNELIALGERFEDIPEPTVAPLAREASGPLHTPRPPEASPSAVKMIGSTLVAALSVGGPTTGVLDTGATGSIIRKDIIRFIPFIKSIDTRSHKIRMADGSLQASKNSITVELNIGDMALDLEFLVVKRGVDHLTLGMDFLSK
uniref:Peptidase A2 domain-containing protein n=1 Tax=Glossina pallidipes TaxID=7398 RepID=A0A1A9ZRK0_GLOPL